MSQIEFGSAVSGTYYAVRRNRFNGQVWNTNTVAYENFNASNWANYAIALTQQGVTGYYVAAAPSDPVGTISSDVIYKQAGGSPATSDTFQTITHNAGENVQQIAGSGGAPVLLAASVNTEVQGTVQTGSISTSSFTSSLSAALASAYVGRTCVFMTGVLAGVATPILGYTPTNGVLSVSTLPSAPSNGDTFVII
jgi:hypothetical protein